MIAFLLVGLILGILARALAGGLRDPQVVLTVPAGLAGAVVGGVAANLLRSEPWAANPPFSVIAAVVVAVIVLGLLEGGVGRKSA